MTLKVLPSRNRFAGLTSGDGWLLLTLVLLFSVILAGLFRLVVSRSKGSNQLLTEADRLAWVSNWQRAGELYARAEELAIQKADKRNQLYAACGRLRSSIGLESVPETSAELTQILQDPIAASDSRLRIRCLATKGDIERDDHPDSAYRAWQEVLNLAEGLGDKSWQARARAELAIIEFMDGKTAKARDLLTSALTSALARADLPTLVVYGSQVGNGLTEMGRAGEALDYCNAALHIAAMVKDIGFPYPAYVCKARALAFLGRPEEGHELLVQTLNQTRRLHVPLEESQVLVALGQVAVAAGDRSAATQYFEEAGRLSRANGFIHSIAWSMYEAAKVYRDEGRYADAERCETQAMKAMREVADQYHLPLHLAVLADLKAKEGDLTKAQELYDQAADVTESLLANSPTEQIKSSLIATMSDIYKGDFAVAAELGQTAEAFRIVETARGRSIADLLRRPRLQEGELSGAQKAAKAEFNRLQRALMETSDGTERKEVLDKLFLAEQLMGVRTQPANAMQDATLHAQPVDLAKLRSVLLPDEAVLEYVLADPTSFCLVIDRKREVIIALPAGGTGISEAIGRYLGQIEAAKPGDRDARKLYDLLLGPVRQLRQTTRLTIISDATLWSLPIETLRGPDGKYVLQSHTVSYAPSGTVLYYLRTLRRPVEPQMAFLGIGAVPYDLEPKDTGTDRGIMRAVSRGIYDISGVHLYRLPASRQEVIGAEQSLNHPNRSVLLLDANATESKFKSEPLANFKILHFAVHGLSSPQFPERAALILGRDPKSNDDGLLQVREITQLSLSADLVTLSACDTATGKLEGEEGIDGLAEAFLLAGAKSVVGALWNVDDSATEALMKDFYTHLAHGQDKAAALRQSKLDYLKRLGDRPPVFWAAFTLVGDGSTPIFF
jgi:CHAT domain-containing protein/tetratricopeptide (TPR) repeat protein